MQGEINDIAIDDLVRFIMPGSRQSLERLILTKNPYAIIVNQDSSESDINQGKQEFIKDCATCHGIDGSGSERAPSLNNRNFKHGDSDWAIYRSIKYGVYGTMMRPHKLSSLKIWQTVSFIRQLKSHKDTDRLHAPPDRMSNLNVSYDELKKLRESGNDWLTYAGSFNSVHHSNLEQITKRNVHRLSLKWMYQFKDVHTKIESTPIVANGIMFMTLPGGTVLAIDAETGSKIWSYNPKSHVVGPNRGIAILNDKVFVGATDGRIIALSIATGRVEWEKRVINEDGYGISSAPLAFGNLIVTGVNTQGGGRGFIVAYNAVSGKEAWRFYTIPAFGEPGNKTWSGDSWKEGGAPTWMTGSYDPDMDILYWGVGNPKPDYSKNIRMGDNLYSNSVVALQGRTGKLLWYFQFTPNDDHDWDSNQTPILWDHVGAHDNMLHKTLLWANRNGFFYRINRITGRYLGAIPYVKQTWAKDINVKTGRPTLKRYDVQDTSKGVEIYPGNVGGTNWWPPAMDQDRELLFIPFIEQGMIFFPSKTNENRSSDTYSWPKSDGKSFYTGIRAIDPNTGSTIWEVDNKPRMYFPYTGGLLSTKSGLLIGSDNGTLFILSATNGNKLFSIRTGGKIFAPPVTYMYRNIQYISITSGTVLLTFALSE